MNNLERFIKVQELDYDKALNELKNGKKISHWMWYIFPQIKGLGQSATSVFYEIKDLQEAKSYLKHPILGKRLLELSKVLLELETNNPQEVFGNIDSLKLKSCMTLFSYISNNNIFDQVLEKYFNNEKDIKTILICKKITNN